MPNLLPRYLKQPRFWQFAFACYWLALFTSTHMPIERLALDRGGADKLAHVAAFTVLTMLMAITWRLSTGRLHARHVPWLWLIVVLYGTIEEMTQPLVNRVASPIDWLADAIGATLGLAVYWFWPRRWLDKVAGDRPSHEAVSSRPGSTER